MSKDLYRLVYYSKNKMPGTATEIARDIAGILATSQQNNAKVGVTGALIFNSGIFAQVLEGSRDAVQQVFERIQRDERHGDVTVLAFEETDRRGFPSWSMAFVGRSREGQDLFSHIADESGFEAKRLQGDRMFAIMHELALEDEAAAA